MSISTQFRRTHVPALLILSFLLCMAGAGQTLAADTSPPLVSLSAPAAGATVRATITVTAAASDDVGVVGVRFQLDGANLNNEDLSAPYSVSWNTTLAANGPHTLTAIARDAAGNEMTSTPVVLTVDNQAPTGSVSINGGALATDTLAVTLTLAASDNSGAVTEMRFSNRSGANTFSAPEPFATTKAWTLSTGSGTKTVYAQFRDAVGNWSASSTRTIILDTAFPTIAVTAPAPNAWLRGAVTLTVVAGDDSGIAGVQFLVDGANVGAEDTASGYSVNWNTATAVFGPHQITAIARDRAGKTTTSAAVNVIVDNVAPTGTVAINDGAVATDVPVVTLALAALDNSGTVTQMRVSNTTTPGLVVPYSATLAWTLTSGSGTKTVYVQYLDAAGNASATMSKSILLDTAPPAVALSAPTAGTTVRGTVTVKATASDASGIAGVQFLLDGASLGAEDTTSSYSVSWNTLTSGNGPHQLSAIARDMAGKTTTSPAVSVVVDNMSPTGSVVINGGAAGTKSTAVTLTLAAADNSGTVSMMRFSNSSSFGSAEPYATTKAWTLTTGSGNKTVSVQYQDPAGNWSGSFSSSIVLDTTAPKISAIAATSNAAGNAATVSWTTNEQASSQVEYGRTITYGNVTALDPTLLTSHGMSLSGLAPQTQYNYRVRSVDAAGNEAIGPNGTLLTLGAAEPDTTAPTAPPTLSAIGVSSSRINLSWAAATDNVAVTGYTIFRDGTQRASTTTTTFTTTTFADTGLAPTTTYLYTVVARDAAGNSSLPSPSASATTNAAGDTTPFSFSVYGDSRGGSVCQDNADHINIVNRILGKDPSFVLHVGDMITGYDTTTNWVSNGHCTTPGQIGSFRDIVAPLSGRLPPPGLPTSFFPVAGNHDDDRGDGWYPDPMGGGICDAFEPALVRQLVPNHLQQPYFRDKTGSSFTIYPDDTFYSRMCSKDAAVKDVYSEFFYYSFDYNNSHFVVMRINNDYFNLRVSCNVANEDSYDTCYNIHQLHWLQYDLARARANPDIKHIFGFLHAPVFTTAQNHQATDSWPYIAQEFSKVKGAVVFSGHNHVYERTVPIYSTTANAGGVRDDVNGTVYLVTGGGGSPLDDFKPPAWFDVTRNSVKHFVTVTVNGDQVSVTATDLNGNVIDSFGF